MTRERPICVKDFQNKGPAPIGLRFLYIYVKFLGAQPVRDSSRCQGRRYPRQLLLVLLLRRSTALRPKDVSF